MTAMEVIAESLAFPEGPVLMADGSVILVEMMAGRITRCWNGRSEVVCEIGGGPNGLAIGPDGALWVCNNGALWETRNGGLMPSPERGPGRIERVDLATGRFERVYESCDGLPLQGPNDLVFDSAGRLWFTDLGVIEDQARVHVGGLFTASPAGELTAIYRRPVSYNGIGLSPDQKHVLVADTLQARIYRYDNRAAAQEPQYVATAMGPVGFDSLAVTQAGNVCAATVFEGGITTVTPAGAVSMLRIPDEPYVTNIAFGGEDLRDAYITLSSTGKLVRMRWDEPGLKLAFNA
jgi:gluconolactonase